LAEEKLFAIASPVDKIVMGRKYKEELGGWLVEAFVDMTQRSEPPTLSEGHRLGVNDLIIIGQLRHRQKEYPGSMFKNVVASALANPSESIPSRW
jgi:hypothetical protein